MTRTALYRVALDDIRPLINRTAIRERIAAAFVAHANGQSRVAAVGHLWFADPPGDCHIKAGYLLGGDYYVVKLASGFSNNPLCGLPANDGMMIVCDARTGQPCFELLDEGWLTSWRTAAAGAVVAQHLAPRAIPAIGIFGTGHQALLQLDWLRDVVACRSVWIYGRRQEAAQTLALRLQQLGYDTTIATTPAALLAAARLVVCATSATGPLFPGDLVQPGTHITALGADSPGKQELDPQLLRQAQLVMTDDHAQCLDHGELGHAVRAGMLASDADISLGAILSGAHPGRVNDGDISIADLTGVAVQDVAIATFVCERLATDTAARNQVHLAKAPAPK